MARKDRCRLIIYSPWQYYGRYRKKKNRKNESKLIIGYNNINNKYNIINSEKAGIDLSDQLLSHSSSVRKSTRWFHKVATDILLGTTIMNALIVWTTWIHLKIN